MDLGVIGGSGSRAQDGGVDLPPERPQSIKKNELKPHLKRQWCIGAITAEYLWKLEQVLDVYEKPYDADYPVLCFDERPCQLLGEVLMPLPMKPGQVQKEDYHYERHGTCAILMAVEPLAAKRVVEVTEQRTKKDYARFMKSLGAAYPHAKQIVLVQDNLNTHNPSSFYEVFEPAEAFALSQRFRMVYTPKKASWLNMAEIELAALAKQCLDRRIAKIETLSSEVQSWTRQRNQQRTQIHWSFTKHDARSKLQRHYHIIKN